MLCETSSSRSSEIWRLRNDTDETIYVKYASLTAPAIVRCEVWLNSDLVDVVYAGAGGSHSWWASAGGSLFQAGIAPRAVARVVVDGPASLRIDLGT